jgi:hypothetical protein
MAADPDFVETTHLTVVLDWSAAVDVGAPR